MGIHQLEQDLRKIPGTANILETKLATLLGTVAVLEAGSNFRSACPQRGEQGGEEDKPPNDGVLHHRKQI